MEWRERTGKKLIITRSSIAQYNARWITYILVTIAALSILSFAIVEFLRFDAMNVLDKVGSLPSKLDEHNALLEEQNKILSGILDSLTNKTSDTTPPESWRDFNENHFSSDQSAQEGSYGYY